MKLYITRFTLPQDVVNSYPEIPWTLQRIQGLYKLVEQAKETNQVFEIYFKNDVPYIREVIIQDVTA